MWFGAPRQEMGHSGGGERDGWGEIVVQGGSVMGEGKRDGWGEIVG